MKKRNYRAQKGNEVRWQIRQTTTPALAILRGAADA